MKLTFSLVLVLLSLLGSWNFAKAANLVQNGGFETGTFADWTVQDASTGSQIGITNQGPAVYDGTYSAYLASTGGLDFISQSLATTAGQTYELTLYLRNPGNVDDNTPDNEFVANVGGSLGSSSITGGNTLVNVVNTTGFYWTEESASFTASSSSTSLILGGNAPDDGDFLLDDVSVVAAPEPSTYALLLGGLGFLAISRLRTRRALV